MPEFKIRALVQMLVFVKKKSTPPFRPRGDHRGRPRGLREALQGGPARAVRQLHPRLLPRRLLRRRGPVRPGLPGDQELPGGQVRVLSGRRHRGARKRL